MSIEVLENPLHVEESAQSRAITVSRVTAVLGAEIGGIDLREDLDAASIAKLRAALFAHKVLFFRDQPITDEQQLRFSRAFGPVTPAHPITVIAHVVGKKSLRGSLVDDSNCPWHHLCFMS